MTEETPIKEWGLDDPQRWECPECSNTFYDDDGWETWHCGECGSEMDPIAPEGYTSNEGLRELVETMRKGAKEMIHHPQDDYEYGRGIGRRNAADQLKDLIDDE